MRRLLLALATMLVLLVAPTVASAAACTLEFTPSTVYVGQGVVATGTDWGSSESLAVQIPADPPYEGEATWTAGADGTLYFGGITANEGELGTRTWTVSGDLTDCVATADLTVLAAPAVPNTDTTPAREGLTPHLAYVAVLLASFGIAAGLTIRRIRRAGR